jgi:Flp pilus assembly pilin Flp
MTITITPEYVYLGVVLLLMFIQVVQWAAISKLKKEINSLWTQISIIAVSSGSLLEGIEKKLNAKEDKKD